MATGIYRDIAEQEKKREQRDIGVIETPDFSYADLVESESQEQQQAAKLSMDSVADKDSGRHTEIFKLAKELGLPSDVVERNYDDLKKERRKQENNKVDKLSKTNPALTGWLTNPDNAAIARDEIEPLANIETGMMTVPSTTFFEDVGGAWSTGTSELHAGTYHLLAAYGMIDLDEASGLISEANKRSQELRTQKPSYAKEFDKIMEEEMGDIDKSWKRFTGSFSKLRDGQILQGLKDYYGGGAATIGETLDMIHEAMFRPRGLIYANVEQAANMLPSIATGGAAAGAGFLVAGPPGAAIGLGVGTFSGQLPVEIGAWINSELAQRGVDTTDPQAIREAYRNPDMMAEIRAEAERKGVTTATIETLGTIVGGRLVGKAGGKVAKTAIGLGVETGTEVLGEFGGQVAAKKGDLEQVSLGESMLEGVISMGQSTATTGFQLGIDAARERKRTKAEEQDQAETRAKAEEKRKELPANPVEAAKEVAIESDDAITTLQAAAALEKVGQEMKKLKNTTEVPGAVGEIVIQTTQGGGAQKIYHQTDDWDEHWTSKGESPAEKAAEIMEDGGKGYAEAKNNGLPLEIAMEKYIEKLGKTEDFEGLLPTAKTRADGMTVNEAKEHVKGLQQLMDILAKEAAEYQEDSDITESTKAVKKDLETQLRSAGFSASDARDQADVLARSTERRARLLGEDPYELYKKQNLQINKIDSFDDIPEGGEMAFAQRDQVETPEFKEWFQDSKITNEQGQPQVVYHGTAAEFDTFKPSKEGPLGEGIYFTDSPDEAASYANVDRKARDFKRPGAQTVPVYLSMKNPLVIKGEADAKTVERAKADGHDGIIFERPRRFVDPAKDKPTTRQETTTHYVVFNPEQVKSSVSNRGTFDPRSENIFFQKQQAERAAKGELGFYSAVEQKILDKMPASAPPDMIRGLLKEMKPEELKWLGLEDFLKTKKKFTKDEVLEYLRANQLQIEEVTLGATTVHNLTQADFSEHDPVGLDDLRKETPELTNAWSMSVPEEIQDEIEYLDVEEYNDNEYQININGNGEMLNAVTFPEAVEEIQQLLTDDFGIKFSDGLTQEGTRFSEYTLPGGENYREVLFTLPELKTPISPEVQKAQAELDSLHEKMKAGEITPKEFSEKGAELQKIIGFERQDKFVSSHFDEKNILAHVRLNDRTDADGNKILFIEEIQSDWHQAGRKKGYREAGKRSPEQVRREYTDTLTEQHAFEKKMVQKYAPEVNVNINTFDNVSERSEARTDYRGLFGNRSYEMIADYNEQTGETRYTVYFSGSQRAEVYVKGKIGDGNLDKVDEALTELYLERAEISEIDALLSDEEKKERYRLAEKLDELKKEKDKTVSSVPDAPFKKSWHEFALKRILTMAVEQGYDKVAWTTGEQQAERYDLSKQVDSVEYAKNEDGTYSLKVLKDGRAILEESSITESKLEDTIGKDVTQKIVDGEGQAVETRELVKRDNIPDDIYNLMIENDNLGFDGPMQALGSIAREDIDLWEFNSKEDRDKFAAWKKSLFKETGSKSLSGLDLKVGGEGMKGFYDNMIPTAAKKLTKKMKGRVGETELGEIEPFDFKRDTFVLNDENPNQIIYGSRKDSSIEIVETIGRDIVVRDYKTKEQIARFADRLSDVEDYFSGVDSAKVHSLEITPEMKEVIGSQGLTLFQETKGRIRFGNNSINIELFKGADESTFLHETGHLWLNEMAQDFNTISALSEKTAEQEQFLEDANEILKYLEVERFEDIKTEHHEKFALAVEKYFLKGEAPVSALRRAFTKFKIWMLNLAKQLKLANVNLTPEVQKVIDRLIATNEELKEEVSNSRMEGLFEDARALGFSEKMAARYEAAREEWSITAEEEIQKEVMADLERERTKFYKKQKRAFKGQAQEEADNMRVYRALEKLRTGTQPDGSPFKLDRQELVAAYGAELVKAKLSRPSVHTKQGGVPLSVAAEILGYENADQMIQEIVNAPKKKDWVETRTEELVQEKYPGIMNNDDLPRIAAEAVHNEKRADVLLLEMEMLMEADPTLRKEIERRLIARMPSKKLVRQEAERIIGQTSVQNLRPHVYRNLERKAAKEAGKAWAKRDATTAFKQKQRELLNSELYRAATNAKKKLEKSQGLLKKVNQKDDKLAKTRDMNFVYAARALLTKYGLGNEKKDPSVYLSKVAEYDPQAYQTLTDLINGASLAADKNPDNLTVDDFVYLMDAVKVFWDMSINAKKYEIEGKKMDMEELVDDLIAQANVHIKPGNKKKYDQKKTRWENFKAGLVGMKAGLTRFESWIKVMDLGDSQGVFRKILFNPINDGIDKYRFEKAIAIEKFLELIKPISQGLKDNKNPIDAPELVSTITGKPKRFNNKAELLGALLHVGNDSNKQKLLRGYGWGDFRDDGTLDTSKWDAFMARMHEQGIITKEDWDAIQQIWDLMESFKADTQKAHHRMYGFFFSEITANEVVTPFGTYKGGYAPAIADPSLTNDAFIRQEEDILKQADNAANFPSTGKGATMSRVEHYAAPLLLDLTMVPRHIDWALRFTYINPEVHQAAKAIRNERLAATINAVDEAIIEDMIMPWLRRTAQQRVSTPATGKGGKALDWTFRKLRSNAGLNVMFANVVNALQQPTGLSIAATVVKPKHLRNASWDYMRSPRKYSADIAEKSKFMNTRVATQMFDIQKHIEDLIVSPNNYERAYDFARKHGYFMQTGTQNFVDNIVWGGAYEQAIEKGLDEKNAVREADQAVRDTQGGMSAENVSRYETGPAILRAFNMFQTYFNMLANHLGAEAAVTVRDLGVKKGAGRLFYLYLFGFAIPAFISDLIVKLSRGLDEDDDDQILDDVLESFFMGQFRTATAMVPIAGPIINNWVNQANDKWYDDRISTSPIIQQLERTGSIVKSVPKALTGEGPKSRAAKDVLTAVGLFSGLPTQGLAKPAGFLLDVSEGEQQPEGFIDFTRGLITGRID